jgi:hypothetical protein
MSSGANQQRTLLFLQIGMQSMDKFVVLRRIADETGVVLDGLPQQ